jgi:phosphoribosylformimino-5-aminoimidazole carboxamide ribotide isomerase
MVTGGSIAVKERETFLDWLKGYGADKIILGGDFRDGKIAVSGWEEGTGLDLMDFLGSFIESGIRKAICTDIALDGMLQGPSMSSYRQILEAFPSLYLVASGGISRMKDLEALEEAGIPAVIIGKAIYEKKILLKDLENFMENQR